MQILKKSDQISNEINNYVVFGFSNIFWWTNKGNRVFIQVV